MYEVDDASDGEERERKRGDAGKWRAEKGDNRAQSPLASAESLHSLIFFNYFSSIYLQLTDNINSSLAERQRYFSPPSLSANWRPAQDPVLATVLGNALA